jgi:hypothetical protein
MSAPSSEGLKKIGSIANCSQTPIAAIVGDFRAGRISRAAAVWRLMFFARDWREIDGWLERGP